jgi:hypothetical protein
VINWGQREADNISKMIIISKYFTFLNHFVDDFMFGIIIFLVILKQNIKQ